MSTADPHTRSGHDPLVDLLAGKIRSQAACTAARVGLIDELVSGPRTVSELALTLGLIVERLEGLVRFLVGLGLLESVPEHRYALTPLGRRLSRDELGPLAAFFGAPEQWDPWSRLADGLAGGPSPFARTFGMDLYAYLACHPDAAARYDSAIDLYTCREAEALNRAYDFGRANHVLDVGGGKGTMLAKILEHWPLIEGTLFDLPHVADATRDSLSRRFGRRVRVVGGDFRVELPSGADHVLFKYLLHNWPDDICIDILSRARTGLEPGGRILVIEAVSTPDCRLDAAAHLNLEMQVLTGGRERRKPELRRLFSRAGLKVERFEQLTDRTWLAVLAA